MADQMISGLTISGLAREGGVGVETVRYYQRRGLMAPRHRGRGIARYGANDVRRLRFIRSAQSAGFTLEEIGELLLLDASDDRARARAIATTRIAHLDARIAELEAARGWLERLARQCADSTTGPCPILAAFDS